MKGNTMNPAYKTDIDAAVQTLKRGGLILYPTDTVWGIGCDATNDEAVRRVYALKQRSDSKACIVLADSVAMVERTVSEIPEVGYQLLDVATEPLTIVYDRGTGVSPLLCAADGSVGVRVTAEPFSQALVRAFRRPLVSTSANIAGESTPMCFKEIDRRIIEGVDYVCMSRRNEGPATKTSTVMRLSADGSFKLLRK